MTRILLLTLLSCFVAPYLVTPSGAPDGHSSAGTGETRQALRGAPQVAEAQIASSEGPRTVRSDRLDGGAPLAAVTRQGLVSWVEPKYGRFYLALPYPRGTRATICGIGGCITRTSTDYGPSQRIHPDRIADLSAVDFEYVCAVPRRFGLCNATLTILKRGDGPAPRALPTAPATDTDGG